MIPFVPRASTALRGLALTLILLLAALNSLRAGESLLKNGELVLDASSKTVVSWKLHPAETALQTIKDDQPGAASHSLAVSIGIPAENDGQLVQRVSVPVGAEKLTVSGWLRSEKPGSAYLQVKLFKGKEELKRFKAGNPSDTEWKQVEHEFLTEGADKVEVICRWSRNTRHEGSQAFFADLKLVP